MLGYVEYGSFVTHRVSFSSRTQMNDILLTLQVRGISGSGRYGVDVELRKDFRTKSGYELREIQRVNQKRRSIKNKVRTKKWLKTKIKQ